MAMDRRFPSVAFTRLGLLIGVPLAVVLGIHAVSWAALTLKTWNNGDTLTAADLNANFDAIKNAMPAPILCTKTVTLAQNTTGYTTPAFTANECTPAMVPGDGYVGALAGLSGCNGFLNYYVNQPTSSTAPTVSVYIPTSCGSPSDQYSFSVLFVHQ